MGVVETDIAADLRRLFGHPGFRPGQRQAVEAFLDGRDVLAVMPTGSGKSLCYQLPALVAPGVTLVVSPLIALMQDQHGALRNRGIDGVEMLTSAMSQDAVTTALGRIRNGEARLVYVAPERFTSARFLDAIAEVGVARLAVDEAHCLSEWGHDFRPDYLRLADVRERLGSPPTMALTATATPRVASDIASALELRDPVMPRTGFDRPNLMFAVVPVAGDRGKPAVLASLLHAPEALPAVVYCGRRRTCEEVADALSAGGLRAAPYHAGLDSERRSATLAAFLGGELDVVCATTAFGMGIDKPDVRSVVHWALPSSPEEYYQQAGRAGRDGLPARCTLLYARRDKGLVVHFIQRARLEASDLAAVHAAAAARADGGGVFRLREAELRIDEPRVALGALERAGALELFPAPAGSFAGRVADPRLSKRHLAAAVIAGRRVERRRWDRLAAIDAYASGTGCRRSALLRYFSGEMSSVPADQCCDVCGAAVVRLPDAEAPAPSPIAGIDPTTAVLHAVDETGGRVGRTRIVQILRGSRGRALVAAGHDRLGSYAALPAHSAEQVLATVDSLIESGALELTGGPYPLVRRTAGSRAATARDAELREQVRALGTPGAEDGVAFLARVLSAADDPELRALAAESLERIGGERAAAALAGT
ncbi:MAG TPA: RecQ family ATP-dependent DNA helicase [Gaiellales bacterium]|nr:RecQ family ATP-dependent DNA helicase [Gaiellales bacterium]